MKKSENNIRKQVIYQLFYVMLLICIGIFAAGRFLGLAEISLWQFMTAIAVAGICTAVWNLHGRGRLLCIVSLSGCLLLFFLLVDHGKLADFWNSYYSWVTNGTGWEESWLTGYECVQSALLALGCYVFWQLAEHVAVLKKLSAALVFGMLIICMVQKILLNHIGVGFCLWYIVLIDLEAVQEKWEKVGQRDLKRYLLCVMPFLGLYFLLLCVMPVSEKPYEWNFVKNAYHQVRETVVTCYQNLTRNEREDFGLAVSGFSENARLGSGFIEDERELLKIKGKDGLKTNVYLTGKIYDTFDGQGWTQLAEGENNDRFLDTLETLYAISCYDEEATRDYIFQTKLTLQYQYFNTGYLFSPLKTCEIGKCDYNCDGPNLVFGEQKGYGTEYTVSYYQINLDQPIFYEMLEQVKEPEEKKWDRLVRQHTAEGAYLFTVEDLVRHQDEIEKYYGQKPELSEKVEALLSEITADADTEVEKLQAIEAELASYTYTKTPGRLPESVQNASDFLDYFMLESRQGYCSYFATAFVLLARAEGIPARYVEGFCIPTNKERSMTVYSNMAHAWPEVYIKGAGWIPFEPTPSYQEKRYTPWKISKREAEQSDYQPLMAEEEDEAEPQPEGIQSEDTAEESEQVSWIEEKKQVILFGIGGILFVMLLILVVDYAIKRYRYRNMQPREQFLAEIRKNIWVLSRCGLERNETETLQEFQKRVRMKGIFGMECRGDFLTDYEEVIYGAKQVSPELCRTVVDERQMMLKDIKERKRILYYLLKFRLFRN